MVLRNAVLAAALLALSGADAKKDKLRVSQWLSTDCGGFPMHNDVEVKMGQCRDVEAQSLKLHHPKNSKDIEWASPEHQKERTCWVSLYKDSTCDVPMGYPDTPAGLNASTLTGFEVPKSFEQCFAPGDKKIYDGIRSVKFFCENKPDGVKPFTSTLLSTHTVWDHRNGATASPSTTTESTVYTYDPRTSSTRRLVERTTPTGEPAHAERDSKWNYTGRWYLHPWARSELCFECWLRKSGNNDKFQCESAPDVDHTGKSPCGLPPHASTLTVSTPATSTATVTRTKKVAALASHRPVGGESHPLEERKMEKKTVRIIHPYSGESTCAEAKWKHAGEGDEQKIVLKGPRKCSKEAENDHIEPAGTTVYAQKFVTTTTVTTTKAKIVATVAATPQVREEMVDKERVLWEPEAWGL